MKIKITRLRLVLIKVKSSKNSDFWNFVLFFLGDSLQLICYSFCYVPVVQWIGHSPAKTVISVRLRAGARKLSSKIWQLFPNEWGFLFRFLYKNYL